jgi:hypothetical protein
MFNFIKTNAIALKLFTQGAKPIRYRINQNKIYKNGSSYFVEMTSGGNSGEGFIRVNRGNKVSYFPAYNRNGKTRVTTYVPFKQRFGNMLYQLKGQA